MAPKVICNPQKLANCLAYFRRSRTAHTIKDLEKQLPSVASINGMQVKDYIQALQDDNKINVEKIGSGNWYWSFVSEDFKLRQRALEDATNGHEKAKLAVEELRSRIADADAQRIFDEAQPRGHSREELLSAKLTLESRVEELRKRLATYADADPVELEKKQTELQRAKEEAETFTDDIYAMEGWLRKMGTPMEALDALRGGLYGDEYDEDAGGLREL